MSSYTAGHAKRDPATGNVAIRTIFPDDGGPMAAQAWLMATTNIGAHFARTADVEPWDDLFVPSVEAVE